MILQPARPGGKPGGELLRVHDASDPNTIPVRPALVAPVAAFNRLVSCHADRDHRGALEAIRSLRQFGWSVVPCTPKGQGARR